MGRRSSHHSEAEPGFFSPHASRVNRGGRSRSGSQSNGRAFGAPGPNSRRPDHAGGFLRGEGLHGIDENEEVNSRRGHRGYPDRPVNRGEGIRAPFDGHNSPQGPPHDFHGEDDILGATLDSRGPPQPRSGRQSFFGGHEDHRGGHARVPLSAQSNRSRGGRPDISTEQPIFGDRNARVNQHDETDDLPLPGPAERQSFGAAGAHPGRPHPFGQRHGPLPQGRESLRHNESHGGSRRGVGDRARSLSIDAHDEPEAGPSSASTTHGGGMIDRGGKEEEGRFVPYTFRMLAPEHAEFLAKIFRVRMSKIKEWCEEDLIRLDMKLGHTNVDPLLSRVPTEDRERYEKKMQTMKNERAIEKKFGSPLSRSTTAYERGFYAGQSNAPYERRGRGYWGGLRR